MSDYNKMLQKELEEIVRSNMYKDAAGNRDICPIYRDYKKLDKLVSYLVAPYAGKVDYVASPEALGFIVGGMAAAKLRVGFIPLRNGDIARLPGEDALRAAYIDHRDQPRALQARKSNFPEGSKVLLVDDWIGTAATIQAGITIVEEANAVVEGIVSFGADYNAATQKFIDTGMLHCVLVNR